MSAINVMVYADTGYHLHDIWEDAVKLASKLNLRILIEFPAAGRKYVAVNSNTSYEYFMKMYKQQVKRL